MLGRDRGAALRGAAVSVAEAVLRPVSVAIWRTPARSIPIRSSLRTQQLCEVIGIS